MPAALWKTATSNAFNTTLNGSIGAADTTITLTSALTLQAPGILVVDRVDSNGTSTPSIREYISFTGKSSNTLTGVSRGLGGSTAQAHNSAAIVEEVMDVDKWNDLITALLNGFTSAGLLDTTKVVDLTTAQALSNKTLSGGTLNGTFAGKPTFTATVGTIVSNSDGSTITFDLSAGNQHKVILGGNRTLAVSNPTVGQCFIVSLIQDGTGSRTVTWFSGISWAGGSTPTLTTTLSKTDVFGFICTGANTYSGFVVGQNV